jgi:hypothetical protein
VAARRRRSPLTAANGSGQIAYHGNSHAVASSSASVVHPAATRQSAPRSVRQRAYRKTTTKPAMKQCRHQLGVPCNPTRRAVSAGRLCVATSCCCSLTAPAKPNACEPKPISPITAISARLSAAVATTRRRSRAVGGATNKNGSASPAVTLTAIPATSAAAPARKRGLAPAVNSSAAASASSSSVSLWSPPTASSSSTGFRPTKAAVKRAECPPSSEVRKPPATSADALVAAAVGATGVAEVAGARVGCLAVRASRPAALLSSAIAARLVATASAFIAHSPPASPSGAIA